MIFKDYYKILGLSTSKATNEEIKQAYREQAKKYHPDINSDNKFSEERFPSLIGWEASINFGISSFGISR